MACTTILVGKNASYDGSTLIARNDDSPSGVFTEKRMSMKNRGEMKSIYKSKISHVTIPLPKDSYKFTYMPNVNNEEGIWGASGINEFNVSMTATETITSNARVLGADPLVKYIKPKGNKKGIPGGIGEEDLVMLVLPFIKTAKEGVLRLASLLETYGTYESNGIAFSDENEIWWLETIGGHHYIARKVNDDEYVVMPNQFGLDRFDFNDAFKAQESNICSKDLKEFILENHLCLNLDNQFNPRLAFGSHDDSDHVYNTPRAWFMCRYFNPRTIKWDGENAQFTPFSDDIPWSLKPERKITIDDIKYILSSHYQGTDYDPYKVDHKTPFRPIGISRTSFMSINQIRPYVDNKLKAIEWICFASNVFNTLMPIYTNAEKLPRYITNTTLTVSLDNFYWSSRILSALGDSHFNLTSIHIERYQENSMNKNYELIKKIDNEYKQNKDINVLNKGNELIANEIKLLTDDTISKVLYVTSCNMKNSFSRSDN